jgi:DNA-binding LacI/PurR family transcriptional regulator/DNA-binding transcriptional regulator YhcF (GntR family)
MTTVAKSSSKSIPAYTQIEARLRTRIESGDWQLGAMLPSRRDLAREYGVSSLTIDRAVTRLVASGHLRADDRRGTFVTDPAAKPAQSLVASAEENGGQRLTAAVRSQVLQPSVTPATVGIVASLHVSRSDHVELNSFWVRLILQSLEHALSDEGRPTRFLNRVQSPSGGPLLSLREALTSLAAEGVSAIAVIALDVDTEQVDDSLSALDGTDIPIVCVTLGELSQPVCHLFYENRSAGYQAADHLVHRGSKEVLFLAPFMASWVKERLEGVQAAVDHRGLPPESVTVFPRRVGTWVQEEDPEQLGYLAACAALDEGLVRSGVVAVNDGVAFGFLRAAAERGRMAGSDFSLVSFDDHPNARSAGLTTLRPPMEMLGRETARLLQKAIRGETTALQVRLRSHLIPRLSTCGER